MELLLILSAMLSAVTGAFSGDRGPEVRSHHAAAIQAQAPCKESVQVAKLEVPALPEVPRITAVFAAAAFELPASIPLYADRPIE